MAVNGRSAARWSSTPALSADPARLATALVAAGLGLALAALPLEIAASLALGVALVAGALIEPLVALAALVAVVPFSTLVTIETGDFSVTAVEPLLALLVVAWLARGFARRDLRLDGGPLALPLGLLLLALLVASLGAARPGLALKETVKWLELAVVGLFSVAYLRRPSRQRAILAVLFVVGAAEALYGVYQYLTGRGPAWFAIGDALRAYGHFEQPNPFAGYLGTILPLGVALAAVRRPTGFVLLAAAAAACAGLAILLSLSRGAWLGLVLAAVAMLVAWGPQARRWLPTAAGGLILLVLLTATNLAPGGWSDRLLAVAENFGIFDVRTVELTSDNFAVVERMAHWQAGWAMFVDHPLFGVGPGNYPAVYDAYFLPGWREPLGHAHNYYLNMAAEAGLFGATALLLLLGALGQTLRRGLARRSASAHRRALLLGLMGSFIVLCVHNLFDNLLVHGLQVQVGLLMGLVVLAAEPTPAGASASATDADDQGDPSSPR